MKRTAISMLMVLLGFLINGAKGESVAGFVHTAVPSNGMAMISMPFHPFGSGLLGNVLQGQFEGDDTPSFSDSVSLWLNDSQAYSNAWFATFIDGNELNGHWVSGTSSEDAQLFDFQLSSGDAFFVHNRQPTASHVFVSGTVPLETNTDIGVFPGLNLLAFAYPSSSSVTNALLSGMQNYVSIWDATTQSYLQASDGAIALGEGFWAERTATNSTLWAQPRPFVGAFNRTGLNPQISGITLDASVPSAALDILSPLSQNMRVDILTLDLERYGDFSLSGWSHADRVASLGYSSFSWLDAAFNFSEPSTHARFYIVGDGSIDTDGDGLSDLLEMYVYGTNPWNSDTDGDGVSDGIEVAFGSDPLVADTPTSYSFWEGFETNTVARGDINEQNGWSVNQAGAGIVQTNDAFEGIASLKIWGENRNDKVKVSRAFTNAPEVVWLDLRQKISVLPEILDEPAGVAIGFFFDRQGHMVVLDGRKPSGSKWVVLVDAPVFEASEWARITARLDYLTRTVDMYLNGVIVAEGIGFASDSPAFTSMSILGSYGQYDNISVNARRPAGLSSDWDTLPDEWEVEMFGSLSQTDVADPDGDGLDNATEYALGTNPLSNDSDGDGIPDGWEVAHGLDPLDPTDAALDPDGDGLSNVTEHQLGTDPNAFELDPRVRQPGLRAEFFATGSTLTSVPDMDALLIRDLIVAPQINYTNTLSAWENVDASLKDYFACRMTGYIQVPADGTYTFHLTSDDGSILQIDGAVVVNDSLSHTLRTASGTVTLTKGFHAISVEYFEKVLNSALILEWEGTSDPGGSPVALDRAVVPASAFWHLPYGNEPPCATLATEDTLFVEGNTIAMHAEAWDVDGEVVELQFCANGTSLFTTAITSSSFVWTNAPAGSFDLTAVVIDDFGGTSTSMPIIVTVAQAPNGYETGLVADFYDFNTSLSSFPDVSAVTATVIRIDETINYARTAIAWEGLPDSMANTFASVHSGYLFVPQSGIYTLILSSDEGSLLWLNGDQIIDFDGLHRMFEKSVTLTLAQGFHPICVQYFESWGVAGLTLEWTGPGIAKQVIPSRCFFRQTGIIDADGDGMEDWWETLHGLDPLDPSDASLDPDDDNLTNLQEFLAGTNPFLADTDDDGIPDDWEVAHGLIGFVDDANADADGDGLSNSFEYAMGTDMFNADTDGDGVDDYTEIFIIHSNPLVADFDGTSETIKRILPSDADAALGAWMRTDAEVRLLGRSGAVIYTNDFVTPSAGMYQIRVNGTGHHTKISELTCIVDGISVGTSNLSSFDGQASTALFYTQWLPAGLHSLRFHFDNIFNGVQFAFNDVEIKSLGGPDADGNGLADWIDSRLAFSEITVNGAIASHVSPYCMRGKVAFLPLVQVTPASTVKPFPGNGWWSDIPLNPADSVSVSVSFENGAVAETASIEWIPFNVLLESDLMLRIGDSLLMTAHPEGIAEGTATIAVAGVTNFVISATETRPFKFTLPGRYAVSAEFSNGGTVETNVLTVTVVGASLDNGIPAWMGKSNTIYLPNVPQTNVAVIVDSDMDVVSLDSYGSGTKCTLSVPTFAGDRSLAVVLPNATASVLDSAPVSGFYAFYTIDGGYHVFKTLADGTRVIENRISASILPDGMSLVMTAFQAGVCFEDGSKKLVLTKDDFDALGDCTYRFYIPPNLTNPCQFLHAYSGKLKIAQ